MTEYQAVIGLEVHVELGTRTKMFCGCATDFGGEPNTRTCAVCLGQPGSLPVVNGRAVEYAIRLGLALGCEIAPTSQFHRKNYFYPDMPKNYQISQYDVPICLRGHLDVGSTRVGITRVHMEEDTGKSTHMRGSLTASGVRSGRLSGSDYSLVDYNRAGIPLLEVVSEPDLRSAGAAQSYLKELQAIVLALGISDAKLEEGSMRCDANISLRPVGQEAYGTRAEVKNMNSVRSLGRAITYEIARQTEVLGSGGTVVQETRHWNEDAGTTSTLRVKETTEDYRYFPDPDLVAIEPPAGWIEKIRAGLPELPAIARGRLGAAGLSGAQADALVGAGLVPLLDSAVTAGAGPSEAANWLANDVTAWVNEHRTAPAELALTGAALAELVALVTDGTLSTTLARQVLAGVLSGEGSPRTVTQARGLAQVSDEAELAAIVDQVIAANPAAAQKVREGNAKAMGALVGPVMKATKGRANPQLINQLLAERLG